MSRFSRKSMAVALSAASVFGVAGAVVVSSPAYACGTAVTYGQWKHIPDTFTWNRSWSWSYFNCSSATVKRKVIVNNGPDSPCYTISPRATKGYSSTETNTLGYHTNQYQRTDPC